MNHVIWYLKQLLPLRYESEFIEHIEDSESAEGGQPTLCIWRMWMGRCFNVRYWRLAE